MSKDGPVYKWQVGGELGAERKPRKLWVATGGGLGRRFGIQNADLPNMLRGLYERVLYRVVDGERNLPPTPLVNVFEDKLTVLRRRLCAATRVCRPLTRQEFVDKYTGRKREVYDKARVSLTTKPLQKSDAFLSTFSKCEKIDLTSKPDPAARVIQPRSPRFNVEVGRFLKEMEKNICLGMAEVWGGTTIFKGLNAEQSGVEMAKIWSCFSDPVAIATDATKFDQHVSVDALKWEHTVYELLTDPRYRPKLRALLAQQLRNTGYARVNGITIKYEIAGRRMSGDMNTGMGNCLLMCSMFYSLRQQLGVHFRIANNGDDCVIICERKNERAIREAITPTFLEFGFAMEVEDTVDILERVSFCQTNPVCVDGQWMMVRDPRVVLDKDSCTTIDLLNGGQKWMHAIGTCGMSLSGGVPVLQEFYTSMIRAGKPGKIMDDPTMDCGFARLAWGMHRKYCDVSPTTRVSFWRAFGILPDLQVAMEDTLRARTIELSAGEQPNQLSPIFHIV